MDKIAMFTRDVGKYREKTAAVVALPNSEAIARMSPKKILALAGALGLIIGGGAVAEDRLSSYLQRKLQKSEKEQ